MSWFLSHSGSGPNGDSDKLDEEATVEQIVGIAGAETDSKASEKKQSELVNAGGLRLSLYAIGKHREATRNAMVLFDLLCQVNDQVYMVYANEI